MKHRLLIVFLVGMLLFLANVAMATNTETTAGNTIMVTLDGSNDWDSRINYPKGIYIYSIILKVSAANDNVVIRDNGPTGNIIFPGLSKDGGPLKVDLPINMIFKPYIKNSDCTLGTPANIKITIIFKAV